MNKFDALVQQVERRVATLDSNESIFFARELEHIKQQTMEVDFQEIKARSLWPINTEADPADKTFTYRQFTKLGAAKIISDYANDIPNIDVEGEEFTSKIKTIADSWGWTIDEIQASAKTNKNLDGRLANAGREAALREENRLSFVGSAPHGIPGVLTNANVNTVVLAADGTGSPTTAWDGKTPDQILRDLNQIANQAKIISKGVEQSNTLLMPVKQWSDLHTRRVPGREITVLKFFLDNSPTITNIEDVEDLVGVGGGSTDIALAYNRNPMKMEMIIPLDWEIRPPQEKGLAVKVIGRQKMGGVVIYRPLSVTKAEGI